MSGGLGRVLRLGAAFIYSLYTNDWRVFAAQVMGERQRVQADKARRRGIDAYNDSLKDRLEMTDVQPRQARTAVLGRVRCVEGVRRRWTSGDNREKLTMIVSFAGHQIDAFEAWYLDDTLVTLDANGWVQTEPWLRITADPTKEQQATLDGAGAATLTLTSVPIPGSVTAVWSAGSGESLVSGPLTLSVSGSVVTVSGGQPLATAIVNYSTSVAKSFVRIRPYLGTSTQSVGGDLAAEYPGELTSTDHFRGIALAVVDVLYDPDIFPQGRPTVTALVRGARVLDPRDGVTRWTENPALHAYWYATWQHGWNVPGSEVRTADVIAAANVCDASVTFQLRKNGVLSGVTLPRYRCGVVLSTEADPRQNMQDLLDTMAGRIGWSGGQVRMRAGHMPTPVEHITQDWIVQPVGDGADEPVISAAQSYTRAQRINRVTGSCVDPDQRYQVLPYPAVQDSALIAAKGERQQEIDFAGANHIAHAQNLARIAIREAQAGLRLEMLCGLQAWKLELGDVVQLTLPRHGVTAKTFEVTGWRWSAESPVALQVQEITADIFDPLAELTGRDPAPDSTLRRPWDVEALTGLAVTSGTTPTLDGSVLTRTTLTWSPAVGASIRQGGQIEVQYVEVGAMPADGADWPSWVEAGTSTRAIIPGLLAGRFYLFRVRAVQPLPLVRGAWTAPVLHQLAGVRVPRIYRQAAAPTTGLITGDEWYDTDDGNKHYVREGGAWVSVRDAGIADALSAAAAAQATADGKIDSFWQATPPGSASEGDLWFDTGDGGKQYRWTSGAWVLAADARIGQAISDAADAQATADGKVRTFVQASAPTAEALGDLWLDNDDGNKLYRWSGSAWVAVPLGTAALAANAATEVYSVTPSSAVTVTQTSFTPDNFIRNTQIAQVTFTPSADGVAAIFFEGRGDYTNSTALTASTSWSIQDVGGTWDSWRKLQQSVPASGTAQFPMQTTRRMDVTGGVTYTVAVYANKLNAGDTLTVDRTELRVEVIKR